MVFLIIDDENKSHVCRIPQVVQPSDDQREHQKNLERPSRVRISALDLPHSAVWGAAERTVKTVEIKASMGCAKDMGEVGEDKCSLPKIFDFISS